MVGKLNKRAKLFVVALLFTVVLSSCGGQRRQFLPGEIPQVVLLSQVDEEYGHQVLNGMLEQYVLDRDDQHIERVQKIVDRLVISANSNSTPWHVHVLKDDKVENAAATRGNYIFAWTGILNKVKDDDELAAVLAHELSHVLAGHTQPTSGEEISEMLSQVSGNMAGEILSANGQLGIVANLAGSLTQALISAMIVNPEQQRKELEADQIGLFLMAKADYNPQKAIDFWDRMQSEGFGDIGPVQFMTSHPSSKARLEQLKRLLPEAQNLRASSKGIDQTGKSIYHSEWTLDTDKKIKKKLRREL